MPPGTLRVPASTQDSNLVHLVTQSVTGCIPTRSVGTIDAQKPMNLVPTLCVGMPPGTLRVPPSAASFGYWAQVTQSVTGCIPTRERGNDRRSEADEPRSHAPRGNASWDAPRPAKRCKFRLCAQVTQSVTGCIPTRERGNDLGRWPFGWLFVQAEISDKDLRLSLGHSVSSLRTPLQTQRTGVAARID